MISLLAKTFSLKVIKAVILYIDTYKQDILPVGNKKNPAKDKCNHCDHMPMLSLLGEIIVYPYFIWLKVLFRLKKQKNV